MITTVVEPKQTRRTSTSKNPMHSTRNELLARDETQRPDSLNTYASKGQEGKQQNKYRLPQGDEPLIRSQEAIYQYYNDLLIQD